MIPSSQDALIPWPAYPRCVHDPLMSHAAAVLAIGWILSVQQCSVQE